MGCEIEFKGELHAIPAGSDLILKVDRLITNEQAENIRAQCVQAFGGERRVIVLGPEMTLMAVAAE